MVNLEKIPQSIHKKCHGRSINKSMVDPEKNAWSIQKKSMVDLEKIPWLIQKKSMVDPEKNSWSI